MSTEAFYEKYRKLSVASLVTGISATGLCTLYFLMWALFDDSLTNFIADYGFMSYVMFSYVCVGVCLIIVAVAAGSIYLMKIKTASYSSKGKDFDITGIIFWPLFLYYSALHFGL